MDQKENQSRLDAQKALLVKDICQYIYLQFRSGELFLLNKLSW